MSKTTAELVSVSAQNLPVLTKGQVRFFSLNQGAGEIFPVLFFVQVSPSKNYTRVFDIVVVGEMMKSAVREGIVAFD